LKKNRTIITNLKGLLKDHFSIHFKLCVIILVLFIPWQHNIAQDSNLNYVSTKTYKIATNSSLPHSSGDVSSGVTYYDGLGRPIQQIAHKQSGTGGDLITHIEYDPLGRQEKSFLPFERTSGSLAFDANAQSNVFSYYNSQQFGNTQNPYSQTEFDSSPLNRVLKKAAPGNDWAMGNDHEVKFYMNILVTSLMNHPS